MGSEGIVRLCDETIIVTIHSSFRDDNFYNPNFSRETWFNFFIGDSTFVPRQKSLREEVDFAPQIPPFLPACKGANPRTC